jgi:hypothetical protein
MLKNILNRTFMLFISLYFCQVIYAQTEGGGGIPPIVGKSGKVYNQQSDIVDRASALDALGLSEGASNKEIKKARNKLAFKYHSDKLVDVPVEENRGMIQLVNQAYDIATGITASKVNEFSWEKRRTVNWEQFNNARPSEEDIRKQAELIRTIEEAEPKLKEIEERVKAERQRITKDMNKFAEDAKSYINKGVKSPIELTGNLNNRLKQYYLMEQIGTLALLEEERSVLKYGELELKEGKEYLKELKRLLKDKNLDPRGRQIVENYIGIASDKNQINYGEIGKKIPFKTRAKAFAGGTVPLYFAMVMRDVFHTITGGWGVSEAMSGNYSEYRKALLSFDGEESWEGTKRTFGHYAQWETHVSLGAFITTSHLIHRGLGTSKVMQRIYRLADRRLYAFGGRTLVRGIAGFGLAMGSGMKVSQIVGTGLMMRNELFNSNDEISSIAWDIFNQQNFSTESFQQLFNIILSFGMADLIWDGRTIPAFYDKLKNLNKKKCAYTYEEILKKAKTNRSLDQARFNNMFSRKELTRITGIFITADLLENFLISKIFFPHAEHRMEEKLMNYYQLLMNVELEAFIDELLISDISDIEDVLDKYESLMLMEYVVSELRGEKDIFVKCLKLRDAGKIEEAKNCLTIFVNSMNWKNTQFIEYYNSVCAPEDRIEYDMALIDDAVENIDSEDHKEMILAHFQQVHADIDPSMSTTNEIAKVVTPELMTEVALHWEKLSLYEGSLIDNARRSNVNDAVNSAELVFELYGMPGFTPLFEKVIRDAWNMTLTSPYGFGLNDFISNSDHRLSSNKGTLYLKKLIYLFSVLYPKMINTEVYERGIPMTQFELRDNLLNALAEGLWGKLKENCKGKDMEKALRALNTARIVMLFSDSEEASANVLYSMDNTFTNLGIEKIYVEVPMGRPSFNYGELDFDTEEYILENFEEDSNALIEELNVGGFIYEEENLQEEDQNLNIEPDTNSSNMLGSDLQIQTNDSVATESEIVEGKKKKGLGIFKRRKNK